MSATVTPIRPTVSAKLAACRRIYASCDGWGAVGRELVLRGDMDDEPEMLRLMAAYEEGKRA